MSINTVEGNQLNQHEFSSDKEISRKNSGSSLNGKSVAVEKTPDSIKQMRSNLLEKSRFHLNEGYGDYTRRRLAIVFTTAAFAGACLISSLIVGVVVIAQGALFTSGGAFILVIAAISLAVFVPACMYYRYCEKNEERSLLFLEEYIGTFLEEGSGDSDEQNIYLNDCQVKLGRDRFGERTITVLDFPGREISCEQQGIKIGNPDEIPPRGCIPQIHQILTIEQNFGKDFGYSREELKGTSRDRQFCESKVNFQVVFLENDDQAIQILDCNGKEVSGDYTGYWAVKNIKYKLEKAHKDKIKNGGS